MSVMLNKKFYSIIFSVEVLLQLTHTHFNVSAHTNCTLHIVSGVYTYISVHVCANTSRQTT